MGKSTNLSELSVALCATEMRQDFHQWLQGPVQLM